MDKVGHQVLIKGDILKAPGNGKNWIVVDVDGDRKVTMVCLGKKITKTDRDLARWSVFNKE